jgi:hypothetical protein
MGYEKIDPSLPLKEPEYGSAFKSGRRHVRSQPAVETQRDRVTRMRSSFAASWLRFILLGCLFLGILAKSMPWKEAELVLTTPVEQQTLQDVVCVQRS